MARPLEPKGAEAVLTLRAVAGNGDVRGYWSEHLTQERRRAYRSRYADEINPQAA